MSLDILINKFGQTKLIGQLTHQDRDIRDTQKVIYIISILY